MSKRAVLGLGFAGLLVAGFAYMVRPVQAQALCAFPNKATYSPGALARYEGQDYQCVWQFGSDLQKQSLGWIKVTRYDGFTAEVQ